MSPQAIATLLLGYTVALVLACLLVYERVVLDPTSEPTGIRIVSLWRNGERIRRALVSGAAQDTLARDCSSCTRVIEAVVDQAPLLGRNLFLLSISLVPGRDGIKIQVGDRTLYLSPLDLLHGQVNDGNKRIGKIPIEIGVDNIDQVIDVAARELSIDRTTLVSQARFERFIVRREDDAAKIWPRRIKPNDVTLNSLNVAIRAAARYLASTVRADGGFVYEINSRTGRAKRGYNWTRHAGATYFLAEAAHLTGDKKTRDAARRAAYHLRYKATLDCGANSCIGEGRRAMLGSSALTLLAYVELERHGLLDTSFINQIRSLAAFLRRMQRADGEFMHIYNRGKNRAVDVQYQFYTGEAAFALARAHRVTQNSEDLAAARAALSYLVGKSRDFFGSRYAFGSEHWTCQALDELWDRVPDRQALRFCLDFNAFSRMGQFDMRSPIGPYDGGISANPFFPPRLTVTSARTEAAAATLTTAVLAGVDQSDIAILENQIRRSLAFILRYQFLPGPIYLLAHPALVFGGVIGSPADWTIRNDFPQHAGSAMIRFACYLNGALRTPQ
ncbi:MAG: hypothetical protein JXA30_02465 [Deltaproteobacteria bacterium]|nr:hypothetical protein [Deltaproteobacteria bacterium]